MNEAAPDQHIALDTKVICGVFVVHFIKALHVKCLFYLVKETLPSFAPQVTLSHTQWHWLVCHSQIYITFHLADAFIQSDYNKSI